MKKLFVLVIALVMAFAALPAFAQDKADWAFYGSVRMWTAWEQVQDNTPPQLSSSGAAGSFFQVGVTKAKAYTIGTDQKGDGDLAWLLQGNSRIGANVKWGNVGGAFEYGSGPSLRLLYGTWNFGPGTLLVGQDYGSYFYLISNMCGVGGAECNGIGYGSIYPGRVPQLKLIMGGFKFSLEQTQSVGSYAVNPAITLGTVTPQSILLVPNAPLETDFQLPRIAASYTFNAGPGQFFIGGQYNQFKEVYNVAGSERNNTVSGWTLGAGTKLSFGPFYTNATIQYGNNPNNAGTGPTTIYPSLQLYDSTLDRSTDAEYMAAQLVLGFKLTDALTFEGGIIWQGGKLDTIVTQDRVKQNTYTYYLQAAWSPTKNVFIIPEIGLVDFQKLRTNAGNLDYGNMSWLGIKWQINF